MPDVVATLIATIGADVTGLRRGLREAEGGLEPLAVGIEERDRGHRGAAHRGRHCREPVQGGVRCGSQDLEVAERGKALGVARGSRRAHAAHLATARSEGDSRCDRRWKRR